MGLIKDYLMELTKKQMYIIIIFALLYLFIYYDTIGRMFLIPLPFYIFKIEIGQIGNYLLSLWVLNVTLAILIRIRVNNFDKFFFKRLISYLFLFVAIENIVTVLIYIFFLGMTFNL